MRSSDRTLLASLGFADPDKGDRRHDLACRYLTQESIAEALAAMVWEDDLETGMGIVKQGRDFARLHHQTSPEDYHAAADQLAKDVDMADEAPHAIKLSRSALEKHITKGDGKYRTTIGFADAVLSFKSVYVKVKSEPAYDPTDGQWVEVCQERRWRRNYLAKPTHTKHTFTYNRRANYGHILVEVKISPVSLGEVLRQIRLYREYLDLEPSYRTVLACAFPLPAAEIDALKEEAITYVHLAGKFDQWCQEQERIAQDAQPDPRHEI